MSVIKSIIFSSINREENPFKAVFLNGGQYAINCGVISGLVFDCNIIFVRDIGKHAY